jgi:hypothetical protein
VAVHHNSNDGEDHLANIISGVLLGALVGGWLGLGACTFIFQGTLLFAGDTMLAGALICVTLGFFLGEGFIEWMKENSWFWRLCRRMRG